MTGGKPQGRACDGCRFRKVKCRGSWPCAQCAHLNLACTFSAPASRSRRHGPRGWLVAQLRDGNGNGRVSNAAAVDNNTLPRRHLDAPPASARPAAFYIDLLPQFSVFVYPLNPIISPREMQDAIENMDISNEDAALVHAFAAITINRTRSSWIPHGEVAALMADLIDCSMRAYRAVELDSDRSHSGALGPLNVTVKRILTTVFLSVCATTLGRPDRSFAFLREGITMLQTLDLHSFPSVDDPGEVARWQRLYWEVYLHERHQALMPTFPSVLVPLKTGLPVTDPEIPPHIDLGFRRLVHLFLVLDDTFLAHWRAQQDPEFSARKSSLTAEWLGYKQTQLDDDIAGTAEAERSLQERGLDGLTELQHIDLSISRLWLRTLIWQLALSGGFLYSDPSATTHEGLSLHFPINSLFREFRALFTRLESVTSVGFHGMGMLEKLFEITSTIADVLALTSRPENIHEEDVSRVEDLLFLVKFLSSFHATPKKQRDYLQEKLETIQGIFTTVDFSGALEHDSPC